MEYTNINEAVEALRGATAAVLLDVRTPDEYAAGHIPGSVNHPLERLRDYDGDPSMPIYAYCRSGARSGRAAALLREMGYEAMNIGGIIDYHGELEK